MMQENAAASSKKLSKAVLDLKFMKKSKEKALVQEENEERQQLYQDQLSSLHEGAEKIVMVSSYVDCFKFLPCRLSFGGMDPDVEKLNEDKLTGLYTVTKSAPKEAVTQMDADVSAQEMASRYRPAPHKPPPGYNEEEGEEGEEEEEEQERVKESKSNAASTQKKKPKKLRPIFSGGKVGDRGGGRGSHNRGRGGNFRGGGRGGDFRAERGGHFRGNRGNDQRGRRGGKDGGWQRGRGSKGMNFDMKAEFPRDSDLGDARPKTWHKDGSMGGKRSYEGSRHQQQGRDSPGHNQSHQHSDGHQHKKIKPDPN